MEIKPDSGSVGMALGSIIIPEIKRRIDQKGVKTPLLLHCFQILYRPDAPVTPEIRLNEEVAGYVVVKRPSKEEDLGKPISYAEIEGFGPKMDLVQSDLNCAHLTVFWIHPNLPQGASDSAIPIFLNLISNSD